MSEQLPPSGSPTRRAKFAVGGAVIFLTLGLLIVWGMARPGAATNYLTPTEVSDFVIIGGEVRMNGTVRPDSIHQDGLTTTFLVTDGDTDVRVTTTSPLPDAFTERSEVVAMGTFEDQVFSAHRVLAKCPSKFKARA